MQSLYYRIVCLSEHFLNLVDFEGGAGRVICAVLQVKDVDVIVAVSLLWGQRKERLSIHAGCPWLEMVAKELEELGQILRECAAMIDAELLEES